MVKYENYQKRSNVYAYEYTNHSITVAFNNENSFYIKDVYVYDMSRCSFIEIQNMIELAHRGYGLNSYINRKIKKRWTKHEHKSVDIDGIEYKEIIL